MADKITECDLDVLHAAMEAKILAAFPALQRVTFDELDRVEMPLPCCLLDNAEMDENSDAADPGTGQQALMARYEARFVIGMRTLRAKQEARKLATAFAAFLANDGTWKPGVSGPAEVIGCYRDDFDPRLDQYEVWRVEWTHVLYFGASIWDGGGILPSKIFLGIAPDIGVGHEKDYVQIAGA